MEQDVKDFLNRIVWSFSLGFLWLVLTFGIGFYNNLVVPERGIRWSNIVFYIWAAGSLAAFIWFLVRTWKRKFPHG